MGDSALDPNDPTVMSVSLGPPWTTAPTPSRGRTFPTVDGHRVRGAFQFSVGEPLSVSASAPIDEQPLLQSPAEAVCEMACAG